MLETVTRAYDTADAELARQVGAADTELDDLHEQCLATLVMRLATAVDVHSHATHLLWIVHKIERIGITRPTSPNGSCSWRPARPRS
jgi:phosphate uptake regulator